MLRPIIPIVMRGEGGQQQSFTLSYVHLTGCKAAPITDALHSDVEGRLHHAHTKEERMQCMALPRQRGCGNDRLTDQQAAEQPLLVRHGRARRDKSRTDWHKPEKVVKTQNLPPTKTKKQKFFGSLF